MKIYKTCKEYADELNNNTKEFIVAGNLKPTLSIYYVHSVATDAYVRSKCKLASELGISVKVFGYDTPPNVQDLRTMLLEDDSDAIIVQRPFYSKEKDSRNLNNVIYNHKDVDGLNRNSDFIPATALGVYNYLKKCTDALESNNTICIIGRSQLVGKPLEELLKEYENLTIILLHSKTKNVSDFTKVADVVVVAVGKKDFLTKDMVKDGALVVDVGINRGTDGRLCGDVAKDVSEIATVTPVPRGVGLLTCAMLMQNVAIASDMSNCLRCVDEY